MSVREMRVPSSGQMMRCLCISVRTHRGLTTTEWMPIPEGMTEIDFGRKFFSSFTVTEPQYRDELAAPEPEQEP